MTSSLMVGRSEVVNSISENLKYPVSACNCDAVPGQRQWTRTICLSKWRWWSSSLFLRGIYVHHYVKIHTQNNKHLHNTNHQPYWNYGAPSPLSFHATILFTNRKCPKILIIALRIVPKLTGNHHFDGGELNTLISPFVICITARALDRLTEANSSRIASGSGVSMVDEIWDWHCLMWVAITGPRNMASRKPRFIPTRVYDYCLLSTFRDTYLGRLWVNGCVQHHLLAWSPLHDFCRMRDWLPSYPH